MTPPTAARRESPKPSRDTVEDSSQINSKDIDEDKRIDNDGGAERVARAKLRDTQISQGGVKQKRSREEIENDDAGSRTRHVRQRSQEQLPGDSVDVSTGEVNGRQDAVTPEPSEATDTEELKGTLASPKTKRTREQTRDSSSAVEPAATPSDDHKAKRVKDSPPAKSHILPAPALKDEEARSPPGVTGDDKGAGSSSPSPPASPQKPPTQTLSALQRTSDEKFKRSGFGSFAATTTSPFGKAAAPSSPFAAAAPPQSPFFAPAAAKTPWAALQAKPATQPSAFAAKQSPLSAFGNTSPQSAFGTSSGKTGSDGVFASSTNTSGFSALGCSSGNVFGAGPATKIEGLSNKPSAFGAAEDDSDEDQDGTSDVADGPEGAKSPLHIDEPKKDKRFYEQRIETGEEGESTMFSQRAKLYHFAKNEAGEGKWTERGSGVLKLNIATGKYDHAVDQPRMEGKPILSEASEEEDEKTAAASPRAPHSARLILRVDGTNKVVLNSPIRKDLKFGEAAEPKDKQLAFMGRLEGVKEAVQLLMLKMNPDKLKELWHFVEDIKDKL